MTIGLVGQSQITTFTTPVNGTTPIDANQVRGNDNTIKTAYDIHDADGTIHLQSSTLAARPASSTAGLKWLTTDGLRIYYDTGSVWSEVAYVPLVGGTATGPITATRLIASTDITSATAFVVASDGTAPSSNGAAITSVLGHATTVASSTVGTQIGSENILKATASGASSYYALRGYGWAAHTSGTLTSVFGVAGTIEAGGSGGTLTNGAALEAGMFVATGATVTNLSGMLVLAPVVNGTATNIRGINVGNMGTGAAIWAITTGTGLVQFGDELICKLSTTSRASLNLPHGSAPTSPVDGDVWTTTAGMFVRINGVTVGPLT